MNEVRKRLNLGRIRDEREWMGNEWGMNEREWGMNDSEWGRNEGWTRVNEEWMWCEQEWIKDLWEIK